MFVNFNYQHLSKNKFEGTCLQSRTKMQIFVIVYKIVKWDRNIFCQPIKWLICWNSVSTSNIVGDMFSHPWEFLQLHNIRAHNNHLDCRKHFIPFYFIFAEVINADLYMQSRFRILCLKLFPNLWCPKQSKLLI